MSDDITIVCDRCGKTVKGLMGTSLDNEGRPNMGFTAGFYRIAKDGEGWGQYTNPGERNVCDECMWADPRYIADYGDSRITKG